MSMQFLLATESANGSCAFAVWLDTTQGTATNPNPAYVRSYNFGPPPSGWTGATLNGTAYTSWPAYCAAEVQLLAAAALAAIPPVSPAPTTLTCIVGTTF